MPRPKTDSVQIAIRVPQKWLEVAEVLAKAISRPGFVASRTDAFRVAIGRGFHAMLIGEPIDADEASMAVDEAMYDAEWVREALGVGPEKPGAAAKRSRKRSR